MWIMTIAYHIRRGYENSFSLYDKFLLILRLAGDFDFGVTSISVKRTCKQGGVYPSLPYNKLLIGSSGQLQFERF